MTMCFLLREASCEPTDFRISEYTQLTYSFDCFFNFSPSEKNEPEFPRFLTCDAREAGGEHRSLL